jgi:hypothetical protein
VKVGVLFSSSALDLGRKLSRLLELICASLRASQRAMFLAAIFGHRKGTQINLQTASLRAPSIGVTIRRQQLLLFRVKIGGNLHDILQAKIGHLQPSG